MCRSQDNGGRRCPGHPRDLEKVQAYNVRRRELYALKMGKTLAPAFLDIKVLRENPREDSEAYSNYLESAKKFSKSIGFDPEGRGALFQYSMVEYKALRDYLNGRFVSYDTEETPQTLWSEAKLAEVESMVNKLDSVLSKAKPSKVARRLYRGVVLHDHLEDHNAWIDEHFPVGGIFHQKGYMSTTLSPTKAADIFSRTLQDDTTSIIIEIISKQGAALNQGTSHFGGSEQEVLFPRNHAFKVVNVFKNVIYNYETTSLLRRRRTIIQVTDMDKENDV